MSRIPDFTQVALDTTATGSLEGWQSQAGGAAIQDVIEARLAKIFKVPVRLHGSLPARHGLPAAHHRPLVRLLACARSPLLAWRAPVAGREPFQPTAR